MIELNFDHEMAQDNEAAFEADVSEYRRAELEALAAEEEFNAWVDGVDAEMENQDIWNFL